jgi:hypothetical protein
LREILTTHAGIVNAQSLTWLKITDTEKLKLSGNYFILRFCFLTFNILGGDYGRENTDLWKGYLTFYNRRS